MDILFCNHICQLLEKMECIHPLSILPHLKVQVIAGGASCSAHISDNLALSYLLSFCYTNGGTVGVESLKGISMFYLDVIAVAATPRVGSVCN